MSARCGGCDTRWTGANVCHCAACHRTFTGVSGFDRHRVRGVCTVARLFLDARGYWTPTEDAKVPSFSGRRPRGVDPGANPRLAEHLRIVR
jgi:hypothetical protein